MKKVGILNSCIVIIGLLSLYLQPIIFNYPIYYDSGVFAYVGSIINASMIPYIDAWDHKGLWIYFYNALGLKVWNGEIRGIYILEYLLVALSILSALKVILSAKVVERKYLCLSVIGLIGAYALFFEGGNLPETIVFPWQIMFYAFGFLLINSREIPAKKVLLLGATFSALALYAALLTRPNNALGIICLTLFLFFKEGGFFKKVFLSSILLLFALIGLYILSNGFLSEMKTNYLDYNFYYSHMSLDKRLKNSIFFSAILALSPLGIFLVLMTIGFIASTPRNFLSLKNIKIFSWNKNFIFFIVFAADFFSQMISGRVGVGYLHYSILILPSLFFMVIIILPSNFKATDSGYFACIFRPISMAVFCAFSFFFVVKFNYQSYINYYYLSDVKNQMVKTIQKYADPGDKIYASWADAWIYVSAQRFCFTRFFYPNPVQHSEFDGRDRLSILMGDYDHSPPKVLVDWDNRLFEKGISIDFLRNKFSSDYVIAESTKFYSIYVKK